MWIWIEKWPLWVQAEIQIAWNCQVPFLIFIHKLLHKQYQKCSDFLKELNLFPQPETSAGSGLSATETSIRMFIQKSAQMTGELECLSEEE